MNSHPPGKSGRLATFWYAPREHHTITPANLAKKEKLWHQNPCDISTARLQLSLGCPTKHLVELLLLGSRIRRNSSASAWSYAILSNGKIMNNNYSMMILTRNNMLSEWHDLIAIQFHSDIYYIRMHAAGGILVLEVSLFCSPLLSISTRHLEASCLVFFACIGAQVVGW